MVLNEHFLDLIESLDNTVAFNLPTPKENALKIEYLSIHEGKSQKAFYPGNSPQLPFAVSEIFLAPIISWQRLTAVNEECKPVYEMTFDIKGSNFHFKPGDSIGIISKNNKQEVEFIINHLELKDVVDLNYCLTLNGGQKGTKIPLHIPSESTLRYVLYNCVDLRGIVKKLFLLALSRYTKDTTEKKILEYLCSKEGSLAYTSHVLNKNICLLDLLITFQSCKPTVEVLLEHLPRLLPRPYSIVNKFNYDRLKICFSVMNIGNNRKGLTTGWLESLILDKNIEEMMNDLSIDKEFNKVPMYVRKNINEFYLPTTYKDPMILIGPGTGVSPYIGFLEEREHLQKSCSDLVFGEVWLFFGCRNPHFDFIYEKELKYFESQKIITRLYTAFSRHENTDDCYVQDIIRKNGKDITKLIMEGAFVYVCGDMQVMATHVKEAIVQCIENHGDKSKEEAEAYIINMQKEKRYLSDIWN